MIAVVVKDGMYVDIDWDQVGTLRQAVAGYDIRTDPLWILVIAAMQGHEGFLEDFTICMRNGVVYGPGEIRALALLPGREGTR